MILSNEREDISLVVFYVLEEADSQTKIEQNMVNWVKDKDHE